MQFSVITADRVKTGYQGSYKILDNAVLEVCPLDDNITIQMSPAYWQQVIEYYRRRDPKKP